MANDDKDKDEGRAVAAGILRGLQAGTGMVARFSGDPGVAGAMAGTNVLLELIAMLVENVGTSKAQDIMRELVSSPAKPITKADLDEQVARIKKELGV